MIDPLSQSQSNHDSHVPVEIFKSMYFVNRNTTTQKSDSREDVRRREKLYMH